MLASCGNQLPKTHLQRLHGSTLRVHEHDLHMSFYRVPTNSIMTYKMNSKKLIGLCQRKEESTTLILYNMNTLSNHKHVDHKCLLYVSYMVGPK